MNKFLKYLVIFLLISFPVSAEKSKLPKCKGDDYKKFCKKVLSLTLLYSLKKRQHV